MRSQAMHPLLEKLGSVCESLASSGTKIFSEDPTHLSAVREVLKLTVTTWILTVILELICIQWTSKLWKLGNGRGRDLWLKGLGFNILNHGVIAPLYFVPTALVVAPGLFEALGEPDHALRFESLTDGRKWFDPSSWPSKDLDTDSSEFFLYDVNFWIRFMIFQVSHGFGYHCMHRLMHSKALYNRVHKFHHRFKEVVVPVTANAVTVQEYFMAYVSPFLLGVLNCVLVAFVYDRTLVPLFGDLPPLRGPGFFSLILTAYHISIANLLIHTPMLEVLSSQVKEKVKSVFGEKAASFVTTKQHLDHHQREMHKHFSASVLDFDGGWLSESVFGMLGKKVSGNNQKIVALVTDMENIHDTADVSWKKE